MPRKTGAAANGAPRADCFNEAAARCRGKLRDADLAGHDNRSLQ